MLLHFLILIGALYAIIKTSDIFIDVARSLGKRLGLKEYFIGSLIVGIGTSLPELFTSIAAVAGGNPSLVAPTVYGTVIANLSAGFGLSVIVLYVWVRMDNRILLITRRHAYAGGSLTFGVSGENNNFIVPLSVAALSVLISLIVFWDNTFSRLDAGMFFVFYLGFLLWELRVHQKPSPDDPEEMESPTVYNGSSRWWVHAVRILGAPVIVLLFLIIAAIVIAPDESLLASPIMDGTFLAGLFGLTCWQIALFRKWINSGKTSNSSTLVRPVNPSSSFSDFSAQKLRNRPVGVLLSLLALSIGIVYLSGVATVEMLLALANDLNIGGTVLAASALAIGTSLPDIVVAFNVARRGLHKMLVGHIIQSNVFDIFLIMGICGLVTPLQNVFTGSSRLSVLFALGLTLPLLITIRTYRINFWGGLGLVLGFMLFLSMIFFTI